MNDKLHTTCIRCKEYKENSNFYTRKRDNKPFSYCKECTSIITIERQKRNKQKSIDYKGGCCNICGYKNCNDALQFHHLDPSKKEFALGQNHLKSFENIVKELDKCILLCARCHVEVHAGLHEEKLKELTKDK